nr:hypothetical protein [uncultured bacterium]
MLALRTVTYCTENEETPFLAEPVNAARIIAAILIVSGLVLMKLSSA